MSKDFNQLMLAPIPSLRKWTLYFILTLISVVISYQWLDRPIAFFAHNHIMTHSPLLNLANAFTQIPRLIVWSTGPVLVIVGLLALKKRPLNKLTTTLFLCGLSISAASSFKAELKLIFGRSWPETWIQNNPSLIHDGVYTFMPFHGGITYASFPSGHVASVCGLTSILWICYPRFWPLYLAMTFIVSIGLVGSNVHYFSDVIAGIFVGLSAGWMTLGLWNTGVRQA